MSVGDGVYDTPLNEDEVGGESPTRIRIEAGLWECEARNNPGNQRFGCTRTKFGIIAYMLFIYN